MKRTNYVLIDYESVQPNQLELLNRDGFVAYVFVGKAQTRLSFETVAAIQDLGERAKYIKISGAGPNALDFHIAFYIGQIGATDPDAVFHIISKDKGFDPLIEHLRERKVFSVRSETIGEIPIIRASTAKTTKERMVLAIDRLRSGNSRPKTLPALRSAIDAILYKQVGEPELQAVIDQIVKAGYVTVTNEKVTFKLTKDA
jgi:septum formation topological specificity factor MinE